MLFIIITYFGEHSLFQSFPNIHRSDYNISSGAGKHVLFAMLYKIPILISFLTFV